MPAPDLRSDETKHRDALIERAIASERERCAKIAESVAALDGIKNEPIYRAKTVGEFVARLIRNQT